MKPKPNELNIINMANYLREWDFITECERNKIINKARQKIAEIECQERINSELKHPIKDVA